MQWEQLTSRALAEAARETGVCLIGMGVVERHGEHLPLGTDYLNVHRIACLAAEREPAVVFPPIYFGQIYEARCFPGTVTLRPSLLLDLIQSVFDEIGRNGFRKIIVCNGHGGNTATLQFAAQMINRDAHIFTCVDTGETSDVDLAELCDTDNDVHAGEIETATSLAIRPDLVDMDAAEAFVPSFSSRYLDFTTKRSVEWYARTSKISASGVLGDPTLATAEKGDRIWRVMVANLVEQHGNAANQIGWKPRVLEKLHDVRVFVSHLRDLAVLLLRHLLEVVVLDEVHDFF